MTWSTARQQWALKAQGPRRLRLGPAGSRLAFARFPLVAPCWPSPRNPGQHLWVQ